MCIDCAACEPVCPVSAIFFEDDVPEDQKKFTPINAKWFEEHDTSGAWRSTAERHDA
jgi:Fe-S-cluster-containing hydrogenase component 2